VKSGSPLAIATAAMSAPFAAGRAKLGRYPSEEARAARLSNAIGSKSASA